MNARAPLVILPRELGQVPPAQALVGQKARGLAQLLAVKSRVPRFGILTAEAFDTHIAQDDIQAVIAAARAASTAQGTWNDDASRVAHGEAMVRAVLRNSLPVAVRIGVHELLSAFANEDQLAVRASVVGEPLEGTVLSGALDSALGVKGKEALEEALLRIMALAFHPRTLGLRESAGLPPIGCRIAVVVQRMVVSESSGVCVSLENAASDVSSESGARSPATWIRGCWGLAGGIGGRHGSPRIPSDVMRVARPVLASEGIDDDARVEVTLVTKETALRADEPPPSATGSAAGPARGARMSAVAEHLKRECCVSTVQARMIAREALRLEASFGKPQVMSWAFAGRLLHILDVEPLIVPVSRVDSARARTWDDRLLPAGLASWTTPLTFSVWQRAAARGVERAGRILGVKGVILEDTRPQMPRLVGHVSGRVYGNVEVLTALLDLLPFADKARAAIAAATGQGELVARSAPPAGFWQRQRQKLDDGRWPGQLEKISLTARAESERYRAEVELTLEKYAARTSGGLSTWDPDALIDAFDDLQDALSKMVAALALSGLTTMLHRVELDELLRETSLAAQPWLAQDLLGGEVPGDLVDLSRRVIAIVELLRKRPALRKLVVDGAASADGGLEGVAARLLASPANSELDSDERRLADELRTLVQGASAACLGELTLEAPRLAERPELALAMVIRLLDADVNGQTIDVLSRAAAGARKKAEYALDEGAIKGSLKKRLLATLESVRSHGRDTALLFVPTERVVERLRTAGLALGERLFEHGLLDQPRDVLQLTASEIAGLVRGTGVDLDGKPLVAARKRQAAARPAGLPRRLATTGVVAGARLDDDREAPVVSLGAADDAGGAIRGRAVSSRIVDAPAMLLEGAAGAKGRSRAAPAGIVLVKHLALRDLPLLLAAKAIVAERGTELSAAAYALRALGIPTVVDALHARALVGAAGAELLRVDGGRGLVARSSPLARVHTPARPNHDAEALLFAREAVLSDPRSRFKAERPAPSLAELPPPPLVRPSRDDVSSASGLRRRNGPAAPAATPDDDSDEFVVIPDRESARPRGGPAPMRPGHISQEETDVDDGDIVQTTDVERD